jgi:carbon-monoxide dehydrogenase medium subunit
MYTMRPAGFSYRRAESLDEALSLLAELEDARPLAGGHSLLPIMKVRLATPATLVDIGRLPGLDEIGRENGALRVGALATHASVGDSDIVRAACPVLAETAAEIGDPQVRNRGTIGGSVAHADPGADYPTVLKALGATITVAGRDGTREIEADDFFTGVFTTALGPGELVTSVSVPVTQAGSGAVYTKHRHPASGYAVVGIAAVVTVDGGKWSSARITIGGVAETPVNADAASEALVGAATSADTIAAAAEKAAEGLPAVIADAYASAEYRTHLARVLTRRTLSAATERAAQ